LNELRLKQGLGPATDRFELWQRNLNDHYEDEPKFATAPEETMRTRRIVHVGGRDRLVSTAKWLYVLAHRKHAVARARARNSACISSSRRGPMRNFFWGGVLKSAYFIQKQCLDGRAAAVRHTTPQIQYTTHKFNTLSKIYVTGPLREGARRRGLERPSCFDELVGFARLFNLSQSSCPARACLRKLTTKHLVLTCSFRLLLCLFCFVLFCFVVSFQGAWRF